LEPIHVDDEAVDMNGAQTSGAGIV